MIEFDLPEPPPFPTWDPNRDSSYHPIHKSLVDSASRAAAVIDPDHYNSYLSDEAYRVGQDHGFAMARIFVAKVLNPEGDRLTDYAIMEYLRLQACRDIGRVVTQDLTGGYPELIKHAKKWNIKSAIPSTHDRP
jgi:hypothetical protein